MSEENSARAGQTGEGGQPPVAAVQDRIVETRHSIVLNGRELRYTVSTGTLVLKAESEKKSELGATAEGEKPKAAVFFTAYTLDDVADKSQRPVTFSFNGGPGSSSVWMHLGLLGPRRVLLDDDGNMLPPPFRLVDNPYSILDVTDLVFIDPVSTGYSRPVPGEMAKDFHGARKDVESVGEFIRLYTTRNLRWTSPKYLIGESYGTTRAAGLAGYLQERFGMYLNGIMLISMVLDMMTLSFDPGNDLPHILFLPTYAATAFYHRKLEPALLEDLPSTLREVSDFALGDYALALMKGAALTAAERAQIVSRLARYTGLPADYIERTDLRVHDQRFTKELLRDKGLTVGRIDSRFRGEDRDSAGEFYEYDPSMANINGPYTAALYDYVRGELKFESDLPYEILNPNLWPVWQFEENRYLNVAETLRKAMTFNPYLRVYIANGYYDLATPFLATEYTVNHLGLPADLRKNIRMGYFEAGHMMYIHIPSLAKLRDDLAQFVGEK